LAISALVSGRPRGGAGWPPGRWAECSNEARTLDLDQVLIICALDNIGSAKTIERNGGILEDVRDTEHGQRGDTGSRSASRKGSADVEDAVTRRPDVRVRDGAARGGAKIVDAL